MSLDLWSGCCVYFPHTVFLIRVSPSVRGSATLRGIQHSSTGVLKETGVFHRLRTQNSQKRELASVDVNSAGASIPDFSASRSLCLPITLPKEFCYGNLGRQVTASNTCSRKHPTGFWTILCPLRLPLPLPIYGREEGCAVWDAPHFLKSAL